MIRTIIGNQKMYMDKEDVLTFTESLKGINKTSLQIIICPSFPYFDYYKGIVDIGSQNVSLYDNGPHTSEVSISQIKSLGVSYCLVGHSEVRKNLSESNSLINAKIKKLLENDIIPILCIGEKYEDRKNKRTKEILIEELEQNLQDLSPKDVEKIIIAYEPIWAIGSGLFPTNVEIENIVKFIKEYLKEKHHSSKNMILYGGSINKNNVKILNNISNIDGYLVGKASTKFDEFEYILNSLQ